MSKRAEQAPIEHTPGGHAPVDHTPGGHAPVDHTPVDHTPGSAPRTTIWRQPKSVLAVAFASVIAFMGIGLVDPILPAISTELGATPGQAMLLFTSYLFITGIAMFFTSWISGRVGSKKTLIIGLVIIVAFAALAGLADSVWQVIGFRAGWGLGNALFISTALATIVGAATGGTDGAIILYEAALGIGIAIGPLLGGALGDISWRAPFLGTAVLMAIGTIALLILLPPQRSRPNHVPLGAGLRAARRPALLVLGLAALCYNFGFFTLLAWTPFPLEDAAARSGITFGAHELGFVFFGWGLCLALTSVLIAPRMTRRFGRIRVLHLTLLLLAIDLAVMALFAEHLQILIIGVIIGGLFLGVMNTVLTESVMDATTLPQNVASSTYSGIRFLGGALAPAVAGSLAAAGGPGTPYLVGAAAVLMAMLILAIGHRRIAHIDLDTAEEMTGNSPGIG
ncbi:MFS transporter [Naumannella halotolerans]|uniref:MFS transporter n=1 Tax=Naumannella halotolerans TaxID=993414 RepID=UPI00370D5603